MTKKCNSCGQEKNLDQFSFSSKTKDKLNYYCKSCRKLVARDYYVKNKNKIISSVRRWQEKNPDEVKQYVKDYRQKIMEKKGI